MFLARHSFLLALLVISCSLSLCKLEVGDCEVCIQYLTKIREEATDVSSEDETSDRLVR